MPTLSFFLTKAFSHQSLSYCSLVPFLVLRQLRGGGMGSEHVLKLRYVNCGWPLKTQVSEDAQTEVDRLSLMSGLGGMDREDHYCASYETSLPHWMWIAAGSCRIDPAQPPAAWFATPELASSQLSLIGEPWRVNILQVKIQPSGYLLMSRKGEPL